MNLRAKVYIESQKKRAQTQFTNRLVLLHGRGLEEKAIQKDTTLRKIKALIRKSDFQLASIAAQEKLNQERLQSKLEKLAAEKAAKEKPPEKTKKKVEEEIQEKKKGKKEKQVKPEQKKVKKEKKPENES
jgi:hypothetical protein